MTVGQLIDELHNYPVEMRVVATWEGCIACVRPENISVAGEWLVINVDQYELDVPATLNKQLQIYGSKLGKI